MKVDTQAPSVGDVPEGQSGKPAPQRVVAKRRSWSDVWGSRWLPYISTPLIIAGALFAWDSYVRLGSVSPFVLPTPVEVGRSFIDLITDSSVWSQHISATLFESLTGFFIAMLVGVSLGYMTGKFRPLEAIAKPFIVASQTVPKVALIPLFILWFGFGPASKIATAAMLAFFPFLTNTSFGIRSLPVSMKEMMVSLNSSPWQTFKKLEFKFILPFIITAAEMALILSLIGAIVGEYLAGDRGLGRLAVQMQNNLMVPELYATILIMTVIGFILYSLIAVVRFWLIPWHESTLIRKRVQD